jgi:hypothetical protein
MAQQNDFRKLSNFDLRSVFISLGLPEASFKDSTSPGRNGLFNVVALNADPSRPDTMWLFRGSKYFVFNLLTGSFEGEEKEIAGNWGGTSWPQGFSTIDGAVWGGAAYPNLWYFFKDNWFFRLNSSQGGSWLVDYGPRGILGAFATGAWANPDGTWKTPGVPVALHGLRPKFDGMIHFFKDGQYIRHNLNTGGTDLGPVPIKDVWNLPEEFLNKIDLAFYGTGETAEEQIFFFSGIQCALYDTKTNQTIKVLPIEEQFPAFAQFIARPQLFLIEDYRLETYVGPSQLGRLIETRNVLPGNEVKTVMVTETIDSSKTTLQESLLDSQNSSVVNNFNQQMHEKTEESEGSEKYRYHLKADAHADASASSLWGGEVNASLNVQGGSDSLRSNFAESAFKSIESQVTEAKQQVRQRTYGSTAEIQHIERVLKQEEIILKNSTEHLRVFEFYQQLQPYITLLVLKNVRIAYADGTGSTQILKMSQLTELVNDKLVNDDERRKLIQFVMNELSVVADQDGQVHSLIQHESQSAGSVVLVPNPTSTFLVKHANGNVQTISTSGLIIKAAKDWLEPTLTMIAVERTQA